MKTTAKAFTAAEAEVCARFFFRLSEQIQIAARENRQADCLSLCRMQGMLRVRIFQINDSGWVTLHATPMDATADDIEEMHQEREAELVGASVYEPRDYDPYEEGGTLA